MLTTIAAPRTASGSATIEGEGPKHHFRNPSWVSREKFQNNLYFSLSIVARQPLKTQENISREENLLP